MDARLCAFPRGEATHYREHALSLGVPDHAILIDPNARSTVDNIILTRQLLADRGIHVESITLISRPYQQRRAYNITRKQWPDVDVICSVQPIELRDYLKQIGDTDLVINTIVGDTQRLALDHEHGTAILEYVPREVAASYRRLVKGGYDLESFVRQAIIGRSRTVGLQLPTVSLLIKGPYAVVGLNDRLAICSPIS